MPSTPSLAEVIGQLELRQLRYVAAVAETGSISAAARTLRIAQPAVTRTIQAIEDRLGVPLFERHARGVAATAFGQALVKHIHLIEANLRHAADDLGELRGEPVDQIRVGVGPLEGVAVMAEAVVRFLARHERTKVIVREGLYPLLEPALLAGDLDLIVGGGGRSTELFSAPNLTVETVGHVRPTIVVRREHPLARRARVQLEDLQHADWIVPHGSGAPYQAFVDAFERRGLRVPTGRLQAAMTSWTALGIVQRSDVVAILPHQLIQHDVASGNLVVLEIDGDFYAFPVYLVQRDDVPLHTAARDLLAEIRTVSYERSGTLT